MGDLIVRGGMGQGILIAAGDVQFENGAAFSGIVTPRDVALMRAKGVNAFLVGEAFMRAPDPGAALTALFG